MARVEADQVDTLEAYLAADYPRSDRGSKRTIDRAVMLLPQPDSPTRPRTSPCSRSNDTSSTTGMDLCSHREGGRQPPNIQELRGVLPVAWIRSG